MERPERDFSDALRRPRKRHQPVAQVEEVLDLCVVAGVFERKVDADDLVFAEAGAEVVFVVEQLEFLHDVVHNQVRVDFGFLI